jgi:tRNA(Ile)-lysidine synthase TilS/MesJ
MTNTAKPKLSLRICERCILPETFPGISFDSEGICNYCRRDELIMKNLPKKKKEYRRHLDQLISEVKSTSPIYDAIMAYSGGKDSSYTLKLLREGYDLRVIAFTFNNHFLSTTALENIKRVTDKLEVDHIIFKPPWPVLSRLFVRTAREDIFPKPTLLRASAICTACIGLVKSLVLKTALHMGIPLIAFGWSPGQAPVQSAIMKTNPALIRQNQEVLKKAFPDDIRKSITPYFVPELYYKLDKEQFPYNIHPLAFFEYNEEKIMHELEALDWRNPQDTDTNSTNCLLNAFANQVHIQRHRFHPYVLEIANMVRQGVMARNEGIEKIYTEQNQEMVAFARNRLDL